MRALLSGRPRWQTSLAILFVAQIFSAVGFSIIYPFFPLYVEELGTHTGLSVELLSGLVFSAEVTNAISVSRTAPPNIARSIITLRQ